MLISSTFQCFIIIIIEGMPRVYNNTLLQHCVGPGNDGDEFHILYHRHFLNLEQKSLKVDEWQSVVRM